MFDRKSFKEARKERKVSQGAFAQIIGCSLRSIQRWESGEKVPCDSEIRIAAKILNIDLSAISDLKEISHSNFTTCPTNLHASASFVDKLEGTISIQDRIFLNGVNAELQNLREKVHKYEQESSSSETIADEINSFIYKKNLNNKFTYINSTYAKFLNVENHLILGKTNEEIFGWDEAKQLNEFEAEAIKAPYIHNKLITIPGSRGKRHGLFSTSSIYEKNGMLQEILVKIEDITNELETIDRYKTLENVIHSSNEILWIKAKDGNYTFVGAPIFSISGYPVNEFTNNSRFWLTNVVDQYDREDVGKFYRTHKTGETIEYKIKTKKNEIKYVREKIFHQDKLTFGIIQDITNELKAQEDKQLLLDVINEMPEVMWIADSNGANIRILSSSIDKLLGEQTENLKCHPDRFINYIEKEDREKYKKWLVSINATSWWKNETKKSMKEKITFRVKFNDTKIKWIEETVYSTLKLKKQGIRFGIFRDITKEHEQQLEMQYLFECVNDMDSMFWAAELVDKEKNKYKYITVSDGVKKIYGLSKTQYVKTIKTLDDTIYHHNNKPINRRRGNMTFPYTSEYKIQIDGREKWLQERIYKRYNLLFGMVRDVTAQKERNIELEAIIGAMNVLDEGIWIGKVDFDQTNAKNIYINPARCKIYEQDMQTILNDPFFWRKNLHPDDYDRIVAESKDNQEGTKLQKFRLLFKDNRVKYILETQFVKTAETIKYSGGFQRVISKELYDRI